MSADSKNNELLKKHFADKLKSARKNAGLTQWELAEMLGIERSLIAKYEGGVATPALLNLPLICKILKISADELLNIS